MRKRILPWLPTTIPPTDRKSLRTWPLVPLTLLLPLLHVWQVLQICWITVHPQACMISRFGFLPHGTWDIPPASSSFTSSFGLNLSHLRPICGTSCLHSNPLGSFQIFRNVKVALYETLPCALHSTWSMIRRPCPPFPLAPPSTPPLLPNEVLLISLTL